MLAAEFVWFIKSRKEMLHKPRNQSNENMVNGFVGPKKLLSKKVIFLFRKHEFSKQASRQPRPALWIYKTFRMNVSSNVLRILTALSHGALKIVLLSISGTSDRSSAPNSSNCLSGFSGHQSQKIQTSEK